MWVLVSERREDVKEVSEEEVGVSREYGKEAGVRMRLG